VARVLGSSPGILDGRDEEEVESVYKGGLVFLHTKGGANNTAIGREAMPNVTTGTNNTATGFRALFADTTGGNNTAHG
jgi:hypothetical protein